MTDLGPLLEQARDAVAPPNEAFQRLAERRNRRRRNQRLAAALLSLVLAAGGLAVVVRAFVGRPAEQPAHREPAPLVDPRVTAQIPVGPFPLGIAAGDGRVWVAVEKGSCQGEIVALKQATNEVTARIPIAGFPNDLAIGHGSLWMEGHLCVTGGEPQAVVARIDLERDEIAATVPLGEAYSSDIAVDAHGVWVTTTLPGAEPSGEIVRIRAQTNEVDLRIPLVGDPRDVVAAEGGVWVLNRLIGAGQELVHIDAETGQIAAIFAGALRVGVGDGLVWMPRRLADGQTGLQRIDPMTSRLVGEPIAGQFIGFAGGHGTLGTLPVGEGGVWFISEGRRLSRLNATTLTIDASVALPEQSWLDAALDFETGTLWVSHSRDVITRIDLRREPNGEAARPSR